MFDRLISQQIQRWLSGQTNEQLLVFIQREILDKITTEQERKLLALLRQDVEKREEQQRAWANQVRATIGEKQ